MKIVIVVTGVVAVAVAMTGLVSGVPSDHAITTHGIATMTSQIRAINTIRT